ncbi:Galactosylceramide sulfotransferase [Stylophora pistillata]|uniref:Galactosylceramide sulfotransferase n=1 Tax=Stylophora pistillata TaxID=50429 RepID=A0A2B4S4X5_STYPI|nr:Galactosylceramide sulfotransferase [Stylophora pistillata]
MEVNPLEQSTDKPKLYCEPVNNILFLKTHKTGSSTMTNILNRYGDTKGLIFAMPAAKKSYSFYWPLSFSLRFTQILRWKSPNILCNHARYNKAPLNWLFPKETTRYVTLLREPTQHFESIFNFFFLGKRFKGLENVSSPLEKFLQNATAYLREANQTKNPGLLKLMKNPALFDLGLDTKYHDDPIIVQNYIGFLQKEFDLVMLMEYFDESLVLLKRRLCWKIDDILYFKLNERRNTDKQNLSSDVKEKIVKWNSGDKLLYDTFKRDLWKMIAEEGADFFKDLVIFRRQLKLIKKACLQEGDFLTKPYAGRLVRGYAVKANISESLNESCGRMIMNEIPYLDYHREKLSRQLLAIDKHENQEQATHVWNKRIWAACAPDSNKRLRLADIMRVRFYKKASCCLVFSIVMLIFLSLQLYEEYDVFTSRMSERELSSRGSGLDSQPRSCKPESNILFLKTHKTGSSTITNMLNRYGDKNDLIITLPVKSFLFQWPSLFRLSFVESTHGKPPNILCNHARYNKVPMNWLFPKENSRYITILRDPVMQFESIFNFFHMWYRFYGLQQASFKLEAFLDNSTLYFDQIKEKVGRYITLNLIKNPALFDLGLDTDFHENLTAVRHYIQFLAQEFDIVMLMDYFDESLVLLKRRFCWQFEDILYFKLNERGKQHVRNNALSKKVRKQIKTWNAGDVLLYDYFNQTLWRKIREEGPEFYRDLSIFRQKLKAIKRACVQEEKVLTPLIPRQRLFVHGYALRSNISKELNDTCHKMTLNEVPFMDYHRDKKKKKFDAIDMSVNKP